MELDSGDLPQRLPDIESAKLRLSWMSPAFIDASLHAGRHTAEQIIGASLPEGWPDAEARRRLVMRMEQMRTSPPSAEWLLRGVIKRVDNSLAGYINFHGLPDEIGRAELGYTIFEEHRRQGYASEAARSMMGWAQQRHGVNTFLVSISPRNEPSLRMAASLGFRRTGSRIDEVDGEEWVFELKLDSPTG